VSVRSRCRRNPNSSSISVQVAASKPAEDRDDFRLHVFCALGTAPTRRGKRAEVPGGTRSGLLSASALDSVLIGISPPLVRDRCLRCGALLYGYTMDLDGSTLVADMARQAGFVNACLGKSPDDLPADVPLLFVRAGHDQSPG
jgi:hypothetical protein